MKRLVFASLFGVCALALFPVTASAQCSDQLLEQAAETLGEFVYVQDYRAKLKKGKKGKPNPIMKYSIILTKGTRYRFVGASAQDFDGRLVMDLYAGAGKMGSNYDKNRAKFYDAIEFTCKRSGLYYLVLSFDEGKEGCGTAVMGFQKSGGSGIQRYLDAD